MTRLRSISSFIQCSLAISTPSTSPPSPSPPPFFSPPPACPSSASHFAAVSFALKLSIATAAAYDAATMRVAGIILSLILGLFFALSPSLVHAADLSLPAPAKFPAEDEHFAVLARDLQARGWNFDDIFARLCRAALTNAQANPHLAVQ